MGSDQVIPLESLLAPISDDKPAGESIRGGELFGDVMDARSSASAVEKNNLFSESEGGEAEPHWRKTIELATDVLQNHSKDIGVACLCVEALARCHGFAGLRDGFRLIDGLLTNFWDDLHPLPDDEDGLEMRIMPLASLNGTGGSEGTLISAIRKIPLTQGYPPGPFHLGKYLRAVEINRIEDEERRRAEIKRAEFSLADIETAVADSDAAFFADIVDDIEQALAAYADANRFLDETCGAADSPPSSNIVQTLESCLQTVRHIAGHRLPRDMPEPVTAPDQASDGEAPPPTGAGPATAPPGSGVASRQDAFRRLAEISDFFRSTEPHSPISYILDRAVRWGDLPLDQLMRELIPDLSAREKYGSLTGVSVDDD